MEKRFGTQGSRRKKQIESQNGVDFDVGAIKQNCQSQKVYKRPQKPGYSVEVPRDRKVGVRQINIESSEEEWSDFSFYDLPDSLKESLHRSVHPEEFGLQVPMVTRPPHHVTAEAHHVHAFLDSETLNPFSSIMGDSTNEQGIGSSKMHLDNNHTFARNRSVDQRTANDLSEETVRVPKKFDGSMYYRHSYGISKRNYDGSAPYAVPRSSAFDDFSYPQITSSSSVVHHKVPPIVVMTDSQLNGSSKVKFSSAQGDALFGDHSFIISNGPTIKSDSRDRAVIRQGKDTRDVQQNNRHTNDVDVKKEHSPKSVSFAHSVKGSGKLSKFSYLSEDEAKKASFREGRRLRIGITRKDNSAQKWQQRQSNVPFLEDSSVEVLVTEEIQRKKDQDDSTREDVAIEGRQRFHQESKFACDNVPLPASPPTRDISGHTDQHLKQQQDVGSVQILSLYGKHNLFNSSQNQGFLRGQSNISLDFDGHRTIPVGLRSSSSGQKDLSHRQSNVTVDMSASTLRYSRCSGDKSLTVEELLSSGSPLSSPEHFSFVKIPPKDCGKQNHRKEHSVDDFDDKGRLLSDLSLTNSFSVDTSRKISSALWAMKLMEATHTSNPNTYQELFIKGRMFRRWFEKTRLKRILRQEDELKLQCAVTFWRRKKQHKYFEAWINSQRNQTAKADELRVRQMLHKGLNALRFAVDQHRQSLVEVQTKANARIMAKYWLKWQRSVQLRLTSRLREAFDKWHMFKVDQTRDKMLEDIADRHILCKNYTKWKVKYDIEQRNGLASLHFKIGLLTKCWHAWRLYTAQSVVKTRLNEVARVHYEEHLQARMFAVWRENSSKSIAAHCLTSKRIVVKAFHCWKNWAQYAKIIRLRFQSMCKEYHRYKMMRQSFAHWRVQLLSRRADRRYKNILQGKIFKLWFLRYKRKVIHRHLCRAVAKKGKKRRFFNRWSLYTKQQGERRSGVVLSLGKWLKGVMFTNWRCFVKRKNFQRSCQLSLTQKKNYLTARKMLDQWLFAMKVANFRRKARMNWSRRCARKACESWKILLKRKYLEERLMDNRKIWRLLILKRIFKMWKQHKRKVDEENEKVARLRVILARSCQARVLQAWRVVNQEQQIISPMVARKQRREMARVFDAWRLHIHRQKNIVDQKTRVTEKVLDKYFLFWRERTYLCMKEREAQEKLRENKLSRAFSVWRCYVKDQRHDRLRLRARRFQVMEKFYSLWKERVRQKADDKVERSGKQARDILLVRWAFRFWQKSTDRRREYRLKQQRTADALYEKTVQRRAWAVWLRRYRGEDWAREHARHKKEGFLRKIFQAWVQYTKDTLRREMLQFTTSLSGIDSSFGSVLSPFRSTLGSSLSETLTSSGYGASIRRGSGSVFTFGPRPNEIRDDDTASLPGRIDQFDNLLRPESPTARPISPISILRDCRPVSPLVFNTTPPSLSPSPSPEHHLPVTPPIRPEELSPMKSEDDTGIHSGSSESDREDDRMSTASYTSCTGRSTQSDMRDREMVATETILHWRNLPLSLTFRTWLKFTRQRKLQKELFNYLTDRKSMELMSNSLAIWRRKLYTEVTSRQHYLDTTRGKCLRAWHEYTDIKRIQEERKLLADDHCRRTRLRGGFQKWHKRCTSKMKLQLLLGQWQKKAIVTDQDKASTKKIQELQNARYLREKFSYWRQMTKKSQEAKRQYIEKLLPKCFAAWHVLSSTRVTNRRKEALFRERRLLTMAFREWQARFRSVNRAVEYIEIKETDGMLKILKGWHEWANGMSTRRKQWRSFRRSFELKHMGQIFSDWLNAAQQIILARRNHEIHTLKSVFICWKDVALQRSRNRRKMQQFKLNCAADLLARSFQFWQKLLTHTELSRTHKQQHDQDVLRECFEEWREYTLEIRADKYHVTATQKKMFLCWYDEYTSRKTTRRLIYTWKNMTEEAKVLNTKAMQFILESNKKQVRRMFDLWVQQAHKIQKAKNHAHNNMMRCALLGLHQYVHRRVEHRRLLRDTQEIKAQELLSSAFQSWKERFQRNMRNVEILEKYLEKKDEELKKYCLVKWVKFMLKCKAAKSYQKRLVQKSFAVWWFALYTKKGMEEIREKMLKRKTREAGIHWKQWTCKVKQQVATAEDLQTQHGERLVKSYFVQWVEATRQKQKAVKQNHANLVKRSFAEWRKFARSRIEERKKIKTFYDQLMKKKASRMFYGWRETLKVVLKQNQLVDGQMVNHNRRIKQCCMKEWRKYTMKSRADKHCDKTVVVKFFLKWKVDTKLRLEEKEKTKQQEEIADRHYCQTLSKTCFRAWLRDAKLELYLVEKQQRLLEKHYNLWRKRIQLNSVASEMGDRRLFEKYWTAWRHQLIRKRVSELMVKHEEKKQLSEVFMAWYHMTLLRRRLLKEWRLYKTRKLFRLWMQKYNES